MTSPSYSTRLYRSSGSGSSSTFPRISQTSTSKNNTYKSSFATPVHRPTSGRNTNECNKLDVNNNPSTSRTNSSVRSQTNYAYKPSYTVGLSGGTSSQYGYSGGSSRGQYSSRSSSAESGQNVATVVSPSRRSTLDTCNRNASCSSQDPDTGVKDGSREGNVGLTNLGNTCFMNSVLQCLINTKRLNDYIMSDKRVPDVNRTTSSMKGALVGEYANLLGEIWTDNPPRSIAPTKLKSKVNTFTPRFNGYNQHDAQEFLRYFLQGLHEDVNRVTTKPKYIGCDEEAEAKMEDSQKAKEYWKRYINFDDSAIVDLFVGQLKSELICQTCKYSSVTFDPFWDLSLPIPKSRYDVDIENCMESFMKEEILDGDERPTCARCKVHRRCTKKFRIQKFPKILVLHLKRFSGERYKQKLSVKVNFELTGLDLRKMGVEGDKSAKYNLYGICNHVGSVYSGHYTAYCKHPHKGQWYSFNDNRVSSIRQHSVVSEEAYLLFYELTD